MTTKSKQQFFYEIEPVRRQLEAWRKTRQHRDRIPEPLWGAMSKLARTYGISSVSAALRVEYYALKDRVEAARKVSAVSKPGLPTFVELKSPVLGQSTDSRVELEDGSGNKMTVRLDSGVDLDLIAMMQVFWSRRT
jgi:adenylyl- and sulfurtransferase ThiI